MSRLLVAQRALTVPGWAKDDLWRNARAVPSLDLQFAGGKSLADAVTGASLVTFTRASTGTFVGSDGVLRSATTNEARFAHNPTTGESLGLLVEEARTNLLLNSATLSTQSVTVAAAANTLSFYGTGTVTLTGVSTAGPLVGTGANNRVSLTFTPTAGVLILTVSGSVTNAQLEAGAFPTSYIPTTTATVTRAADVASITGTAFSSFYNQTEGTWFAQHDKRGVILVANNNSFNERQPQMGLSSALTHEFYVIVGGVIQASNAGAVHTMGTTDKTVYAIQANNFIGAVNGVLTNADTSGSVSSTVSQLNIGVFQNLASGETGTIKRLTYWPVRLANPTLQAITQP